MATSSDTHEPAVELPEPPTGPPEAQRPRLKAVTIGTVCKALSQEFPDISISKIRYLEDQKLLSPRRTQGGYRLYTQSDVQRLRTILRLQRDEFLPLRVIRQELAGGRAEREVAPAPTGGPSDGRSLRRALVSTRDPGALYSLEDVVEEMARKIAQIPLTTLMAVKNNVKRAYELMGMRVHLQVSHILTNMVGAASDVQSRRAELMQSGLKPKDFVDRDDSS